MMKREQQRLENEAQRAEEDGDGVKAECLWEESRKLSGMVAKLLAESQKK